MDALWLEGQVLSEGYAVSILQPAVLGGGSRGSACRLRTLGYISC
jgi:hypothetical protein